MLRCLLLGILIVGSAVLGRADVIDFETGSFNLSSGQTGSLEGFDFTAGGGGAAFVLVPVTAGGCIPPCISDGTKTLGAFNDANVTIAPSGGGPFNLLAFDVAGTFTSLTSRNATSLEVIGNLFGGGQVTETFAGINPNVFETLPLLPVFTDLTSAEFLGLTPAGLNSPEFQLDNIVVSSVPEPASVVLLGTLVLALAASTYTSPYRRKRRR